MTNIRMNGLSGAAIAVLGLMLACGSAMAQQATAKTRQIVIEAATEATAPAAVKAPVKIAEAPKSDDAATLSEDDKAEVAKAIDETNAKAEEPAAKVVEAPAKAAEEPVKVVAEEPAPVVKQVEKKITSKVVLIEQDGVTYKVRKFSNGSYKVLGYVENYGYEQSSYSYGNGENCSNGY